MITRTMKHLPGGIAPRPLRFAMALIIAAGMCLAAPPAAQADVKVTIKAPRQEVVIGESTVGFEAQMESCTVHHRGSGFVEFAPPGADPVRRVEPPPAPSEITGFGAGLFLDRDQQARGALSVFTSRERRTYEALFGAAFRTASGEVEVFVFSLLDTRRGFLSPNDHAIRATGGTTTSQPGCLIWDLVNGTSGQVNGVFDAEGTLRVWLPPARPLTLAAAPAHSRAKLHFIP